MDLDEKLTQESLGSLIGLMDYKNCSYNDVFERFETGDITSEEFRARLKGVASDLGKPVPLDFAIDKAWNKMILELTKKNFDVVAQLGSRYKLFLLSNTNAIHLDYFKRNSFRGDFGFSDFERIFSQTFYSHLIGLRKPDKAAFQYVLGRGSIKAEKTLFIDDNEPNFKGAIECGISCYCLDGDLKDIGLDLSNV